MFLPDLFPSVVIITIYKEKHFRICKSHFLLPMKENIEEINKTFEIMHKDHFKNKTSEFHENNWIFIESNVSIKAFFSQFLNKI